MIAAAGYDTDRVAAVRCINCHEPIGDSEYNEVTTLARFGQMLFEHTTCPINTETTNNENHDHD